VLVSRPSSVYVGLAIAGMKQWDGRWSVEGHRDTVPSDSRIGEGMCQFEGHQMERS
jgi:hypothetical protein